jgi:hypothetical protein
MLTALFSLFLLSSDAAATTAAASTEVPATAQSSVAPKEEKKICKRELVTGQIQGTKRICMTAKQWEAARAGPRSTRR